MSNRTHPHKKLNTGQSDELERYISETIREAESNPPSDLWAFCTDQTDLVFILRKIDKEGKIEEY